MPWQGGCRVQGTGIPCHGRAVAGRWQAEITCRASRMCMYMCMHMCMYMYVEITCLASRTCMRAFLGLREGATVTLTLTSRPYPSPSPLASRLSPLAPHPSPLPLTSHPSPLTRTSHLSPSPFTLTLPACEPYGTPHAHVHAHVHASCTCIMYMHVCMHAYACVYVVPACESCATPTGRASPRAAWTRQPAAR